MKSLVYLLIAGVFSCDIFAEEFTPKNNASKPGVDIVVNIHNFCVEQHSEYEEPNIEKYLFNCVNNDLAASAYQLFKSYSELTLFIKLVDGE